MLHAHIQPCTCIYSHTQSHCRELFASLDRCESILETQEYIAGNQLTEADIRLFMTLIRFDEVYVVYFKTNKKFIHEYPRLKVCGVRGVQKGSMRVCGGSVHMCGL